MGNHREHTAFPGVDWMSIPLIYRAVALLSLVGTFLLMLVGGYVMAIGAGMACPGWPLCYGSYVPFFQPTVLTNAPYTEMQIFAEWFHRFLALVVGFLVIAMGIMAWRIGTRPTFRWSGLIALVLVPLQAALGAWTVISGNAPLIVVAHLGTALLLFAVLLINVMIAFGFPTGSRDTPSPR